MKTPQDYGLNDGYILPPGTVAPDDHATIQHPNDETVFAVPKLILDEEYTNYAINVGQPIVEPTIFDKAFVKAMAVFKGMGVAKSQGADRTLIGVDFKGNGIYSDTKLANDKSTAKGKQLATTSGIALGAMGAFNSPKEAQSFIQIGEKGSDPVFHAELDTFRKNKDPKGFVSAVNKIAPLDTKSTDYTAYKLYETWDNLSPAQKAIGVSSTGIQGYKFDNGETFETKRLTPPVPGIPQMTAGEGLTMAQKGINVPPATQNWSQFATLQKTFNTPKKSTDVVETAFSLGMLGHDMDGRAVPINEKTMAQFDVQPAPNYGVGAATIPVGQGAPSGYIPLKTINGRTIVIPNANRNTAVINAPDVAVKAASETYSKWSKVDKVKQDRGVVGGSALVGGLSDMTVSNPYSLGAVITDATYQNVDGVKDQTDLEHVTHMSGITMHRLTAGEASKNVDKKGIDYKTSGEFNQDTFEKAMKVARGRWSENGIPSREAAYQLANQAFAEGRLNHSQLVAAQRSIDMTFSTDGYRLAQKLNTGKNRGIEILEENRG